MPWIKDENDRFVNIDNWDVLDHLTVSDQKTNFPVAIKVYLQRRDEELVLGYIDYNETTKVDEILECLYKGVLIELTTLNDLLYYYLRDEFNEKFGEVDCGKGFSSDYEKRHLEIGKLIMTRFVED